MSAVNSLVSMERVRLLKGVKAPTFLEADAHPFLLKKNNRIKRKNPFEEVWFVKQTDVAVSVVLLLFLRQENILCFQFGKQCCPARKRKKNLGDRVGFCLSSLLFPHKFLDVLVKNTRFF